MAHRSALLAFLRSRSAGEAAEDLLQELWLRLPDDTTEIRNPRAYLFRMANMLLIDLHRHQRQARQRDTAWMAAVGPAVAGQSDLPSADRMLEAREVAARVLAALDGAGPRVSRVFRRHRLDGVSQRDVAVEMQVSLSTVESDLRRGYAALMALRDEMTKE